jgi:hypothetical protein
MVPTGSCTGPSHGCPAVPIPAAVAAARPARPSASVTSTGREPEPPL